MSTTPQQRKRLLDQELKRILEVLVSSYGPKKVILFGSLSSGRIHEWSDIDLVVIKETDKRFLDRAKEVLLLVRPRVGCDIVVYTPQEFEEMLMEKNRFLAEEIDQEGKVLYEAA